MHNLNVLLIIGSAVLIALSAGKAVNRFRIPMVVGYVFAGIFLGHSFLNIVSPETLHKIQLLSDLTLGVIAFMIGGELNISHLKKLGRTVFAIAVCEAFGAFFLVAVFASLLTGKVYLGLILGAVASATAPAATVAVINQYKARGPLTSTILGIVASDDAIALIIYSFAAAFAFPLVSGIKISAASALFTPLKEIILSCLLGGLLGAGLSFVLRRLPLKGERVAVSVGIFLLAEGIAVQFNLSELLVIMIMAAVSGNIIPRKFSPVIEAFNLMGLPLIAAFFCLAATRLDIKLLPQIGVLGIVYLAARMSGKFFGAGLGAKLSGALPVVRKYVGLSLWPQIGIAVALAIIVEKDFSPLGKEGQHLAKLVMNILLFTTVITEIVGPIATKFALLKAKEIDSDREVKEAE